MHLHAYTHVMPETSIRLFQFALSASAFMRRRQWPHQQQSLNCKSNKKIDKILQLKIQELVKQPPHNSH